MTKIGIGLGIVYARVQGEGGSPPSIVTAPVLSGLNIVGETLTCTSGTWSGTPPIAYLYSFYADGVTLLQQSASATYVPVSADSGKEITCLVDAANAFGSGFSESNGIWVITADLINLQSYDAAKFTLSGSQITAWTEQDGITQWTQSVAADRPLLTGGVPTFAGSGDALVRATDVSATSFSLFCVVRNTLGATNKSIFASITGTNWYNINAGDFSGVINVAGAGLFSALSGYLGKRDTVIGIIRNGNTINLYINNRVCIVRTSNFAGQPTLIGRLMSIAGFTTFALAGTLKSFIVSSSVLNSAQIQDVINSLYDKYNLSSNTDTDTILAFGDSNTLGSNATSYVVGLAAQMGLGYTQLGIAGSRFTTFNSNSGYARYQSQLITRPYTDKIVIQYGTNDISGGVNLATYETEFTAMMNDFIAQGINPSNICICSVAYRRDNADAAILDNYRAFLLATSIAFGTKYFDLLQDMRDNGGNALLNDAVHLNQTGQNRWQAGVYAAFTS
jgi:lysophospholipase L1-like esterase